MKAHIKKFPVMDKMSRSEGIVMTDNLNQKITYKFGNITFVVTPIYQKEQGEPISNVLLRLMKADAEGV